MTNEQDPYSWDQRFPLTSPLLYSWMAFLPAVLMMGGALVAREVLLLIAGLLALIVSILFYDRHLRHRGKLP